MEYLNLLNVNNKVHIFAKYAHDSLAFFTCLHVFLYICCAK